MNFVALVPTKGKGRSSGIGIKVSGLNLKFNRETVDELGLRDHIQFALNPDQPGKLYIMTNNPELTKFPLNGENTKNGSRYLSDGVVAKTCKLSDGETYPIQKHDGLNYIEFDPNANWDAPKRKPAQPKKAKGESEPGEGKPKANKKIRSEE